MTGTAGTAMVRGVAVGATDNQFVTGGLDDGTAKSAYIKKYLGKGPPGN